MGFIKENIGIISKVMMVMFLLSIVGVATFQSSLFSERPGEQETEQETQNTTFEEENRTPETIPAETTDTPHKPEEIIPKTEEDIQTKTENVSAQQPPKCEPAEDLPTDAVELHRRIANLSEENRMLLKTVENQKNYIQTYKSQKDKAERDLAKCLKNPGGTS